MSYRQLSKASNAIAAGGVLLLIRDLFTFVYHRALDALFPGNSSMADTVLSWIFIGLIIGGIVVLYWPRIKETISGKPVADDVTPSGMKIYRGRVINLKRLKGTFFKDCLFCDVNFIDEAVVHIREGNWFAAVYEVDALNYWIDADNKKTLKDAVQFDRCAFIKCRIRTSRIAGNQETITALLHHLPNNLITIEKANLEYISTPLSPR